MRVQRKMGRTNESQFDLFASMGGSVLQSAVAKDSAALHKPAQVGAKVVAKRPVAPAVISTPVRSPRRPRQVEMEVRIVSRSDLPVYRADEVALVDATLAQLPQEKLWFTYADIARVFTVSRATVKRRAKAGMIPDIRFEGERVLEDGAIRRFTREQVRYLLLSLRRR